MWCGAMPAEEPYATIALIGSAYWFAYFIIILPILGIIETPDKQPDTIEDAVKQAENEKASKTKQKTNDLDGSAVPAE